MNLTSKSIEGTSLSLQGIDHIHGSDSLPLGMFSVGNSISDDILKENLENSTSLLIDESRDTLDSTTTSQPPDSRLGDTLDVVSQHLPVTLSASLSQSLSTFSTSSHVADVSVNDDYTTLDRVYILWYNQSEVLESAVAVSHSIDLLVTVLLKSSGKIRVRHTQRHLFCRHRAHISEVRPAFNISFI